MEALSDYRREQFCRIMAAEDISAATAAFRAGYGAATHPRQDGYHELCAQRLMCREDVVLRINTLRQIQEREEEDYTKGMISKLKKVIDFDYGKYFSTQTVTMNNGRIVNDFYLKVDYARWDPKDRELMIDGFESNGRPRFVSKQWAWEKLLKIYKLDQNTNVDIEDLKGLFLAAGVRAGIAEDLRQLQTEAWGREADEELTD